MVLLKYELPSFNMTLFLKTKNMLIKEKKMYLNDAEENPISDPRWRIVFCILNTQYPR